MSMMRDFICVTSIHDGRKALIRSACIEAVIDNEAEPQDFGLKPEHRTIVYSGCVFDAGESLEEIQRMMFDAEM